MLSALLCPLASLPLPFRLLSVRLSTWTSSPITPGLVLCLPPRLPTLPHHSLLPLQSNLSIGSQSWRTFFSAYRLCPQITLQSPDCLFSPLIFSFWSSWRRIEAVYTTPKLPCIAPHRIALHRLDRSLLYGTFRLPTSLPALASPRIFQRLHFPSHQSQHNFIPSRSIHPSPSSATLLHPLPRLYCSGFITSAAAKSPARRTRSSRIGLRSDLNRGCQQSLFKHPSKTSSLNSQLIHLTSDSHLTCAPNKPDLQPFNSASERSDFDQSQWVAV